MFINQPKTKNDFMWIALMVSITIALYSVSESQENKVELANRDYIVNTVLPYLNNQVAQINHNQMAICIKFNIECVDDFNRVNIQIEEDQFLINVSDRT